MKRSALFIFCTLFSVAFFGQQNKNDAASSYKFSVSSSYISITNPFPKSENGEYKTVNNMGDVINNKTGYTADPCTAPVESYIIFPSVLTPGSNNGDLYISFNKNGTWTEPVNMGNLINPNANEYGPFLLPDGKY
jgi:hypothetical protein